MGKFLNFQLLIGLFLIALSFYMLYDGISITERVASAMVTGQGVVFMFWGIRELIGGLINGNSNSKE